MTALDASWTTVLNDLEHQVLSARACLDAGEDLPAALLEPWTPPTSLAAMTIDEAARARALVAQYADLDALLLSARASVNAALARTTRAAISGSRDGAFAASATPRYFDGRA